MENKSKLLPSSIIKLFDQCRDDCVAPPHCILLERVSGEPVDKQWANRPLDLIEVLDGLIDHDVGLIPASIRAVILETDLDISLPIEVIVGEHRDAFQIIARTIPGRVVGRHAWLQCEDADRIVDNPVHFRGLKVGEMRGAGNWIKLTNDVLEPFFDCAGFWTEGTPMLDFDDVQDLTKLTCSFFDMMNSSGLTKLASGKETFDALLTIHDRGQLRQMGNPLVFRLGLHESEYGADLVKQLRHVFA